MVLIVRHRYAHYRRYLLDIWGVVRLGTLDLDKFPYVLGTHISADGRRWLDNHRLSVWLDQGSRRRTRLLLFFHKLWDRRRRQRYQKARKYIYRIELRGPTKIRRYRRPTFLAVRLVRLFYLSYNYRQLRRLILGAHKSIGLYEENLLFTLEGKLMCFLYRTSMVSSFFASMDFIKCDTVLVNNTPVGSIHHKICQGDLVHFTRTGSSVIYVRLLRRLRKRASFFPPAPFLFVSFAMLCAYYTRAPRFRELIFPVRLDLHSVVNYFGGRK